MAAKRYICSITVCGRDRSQIPAGHTFIQAEIIKHSFDSLVAQGYVTEYTPGQMFRPVGASQARRLSTIERNTPDMAINPPKKTEAAKKAERFAANERRREDSVVKAEAATAKAEGVEAKAKAELAEEVEAQEAIKKDAPVVVTQGADCVWTMNPVKCEEMEIQQLASIYLDKCKKHGKEVKNMVSKEALVAQLSSEFKS